MPINSRIEDYNEKIDVLQAQKDVVDRQSAIYSWSRLIILLLAIPLLYLVSNYSVLAVVVMAIFSLSSFIYAVIKQQKLESKSTELKLEMEVLANEIDSVLNHKNVYYNGEDYQEDYHYYANDLDVLGEYSLFHLLNRAKTYAGNQYLRLWLMVKPKRREILRRQAATQELMQKSDWMDNFQTSLFQLEKQETNHLTEKIKDILSFDMDEFLKTWISVLIKTLPFVLIIIVVLLFISPSLAGTIATIVFVINFFISGRYIKSVTEVQDRLTRATVSLKNYEKALELIVGENWQSELISDNFAQINGGEFASIKRLRIIMDKLDFRLNLIATLVLNGFLLWDLRMMRELADWKENYEEELYQVIDLIGLLEGMVGLARYAYNHENMYYFSEISTDYFNVEGVGMVHPLMLPNQCVANQYKMVDPKRLSIITGSNMAGKSTFLRTLGANIILAYSGTVSASKILRIPVVQIISYMRIKDDLEEKVSTFKAELNRIEMILDYIETGQPCLLLIDEMLRGTNSKDKLQGSIALTKKLIESKTPAIIATHDIKLADLEKLHPNEVSNYYFDISFKNDELEFDYKLKSGICDTFNASYLLKKLGLDYSNQ